MQRLSVGITGFTVRHCLLSAVAPPLAKKEHLLWASKLLCGYVIFQGYLLMVPVAAAN